MLVGFVIECVMEDVSCVRSRVGIVSDGLEVRDDAADCEGDDDSEFHLMLNDPVRCAVVELDMVMFGKVSDRDGEADAAERDNKFDEFVRELVTSLVSVELTLTISHETVRDGVRRADGDAVGDTLLVGGGADNDGVPRGCERVNDE